MSLALELPPERGPHIQSGEENTTYQIRDQLSVGDIITIMAGDVHRKIRITGKRWISDTEMDERLRAELSGKIPERVGFSGAFLITFDYADTRKYGEDVDKIAEII